MTRLKSQIKRLACRAIIFCADKAIGSSLFKSLSAAKASESAVIFDQDIFSPELLSASTLWWSKVRRAAK